MMAFAKLEGMFDHSTIMNDTPVSLLITESIQNGEGVLSDTGALVIHTGKYTGRSPKDRFFVNDRTAEGTIAFGDVNLALEYKDYLKILGRIKNYLPGRRLYRQDICVGASSRFRVPFVIYSEKASQALFVRQMFQREIQLPEGFEGYTVLSIPGFLGMGSEEGLRSEAFVIISLEDRVILIGGTQYSGEIKKSIFSIMNYLMPVQGVLPMHCSANMDEDGNTAVFFGLSGTGKTTLSADSSRILIGDDEHGWSDEGVFNFEAGCYAKVINLEPTQEPEIYSAIRFGSMLENVILKDTGQPDFSNDTLTENTRASYPLKYIRNSSKTGRGHEPSAIIFLTADAFGVLPPVARLSNEEAMYHFLSGYTSKLAGTERGIIQPEATFSALFGEPFMPREVSIYAELLGNKLDACDTCVHLVNTGWTGGPYGVGKRISLKYTRRMVDSILTGEIEKEKFEKEPYFGLDIPKSIPGIPADLLRPEKMWADISAYKIAAAELIERFNENFSRFGHIDQRIRMAGPRSL
jgi:phosphoenolpyruvate carboxykinase (ATP)